ncbi:MAG TPA: methyltransferase domain-containing protein [Acidimicrobiales bacterium]|nr:methyltransferase domain-containing protein [Acidimicrobiales bacterium]
MRYLVLGIPGLAPLIAEELSGDLSGNDGRADVVLVDRPGRVFTTRLGEDVLVEITNVATRRPLRSLVGEITAALNGLQMEKALSVWTGWRRPLSARMSFRVVARLLSEDAFLRTELREALTHEIGRARPAWRTADPSDLEVWALEDRPGRLRIGLRLTTGELRNRGGRVEEREAALRPTLAAAMVHLAGDADGILVDPCCGSGTILSEALAAGWTPFGADIDAAALAAAARNVNANRLWLGDARRLPLFDGTVSAMVSNLPFGEQHRLPQRPGPWFSAVIAEAARLTNGGPVVILAPKSRELEGAIGGSDLQVTRSFDVRLLGRRATIFSLSA